MGTYALKSTNGETINKIKALSNAEAEKLFAKIKTLNVEDLLKIFNVVKIM